MRIRIRQAAFKHQGLNFKLYINKTPTVKKKPDAPETSGGVDVQSDFPRGLPFHHRTSSIRNDFSMTDRLQTSTSLEIKVRIRLFTPMQIRIQLFPLKRILIRIGFFTDRICKTGLQTLQGSKVSFQGSRA